MLTNLPIVGFIPIVDVEKAKKFYVDVLKLELVADEEYAVVLKVPGAMIRLVKMPEYKPVDFTILGWEATDIVATVRALKDAGVTCERYEYFEQDELGIWSAPDRAARIAWFKDPEGNVLSISQH